MENIIHLIFLQKQVYAPYSKWLGTAYLQLEDHSDFPQLLASALAAATDREREDYLQKAYQAVAIRHNALGITPVLDTDLRPFYSRPFLILDAGRFAAALRREIASPFLAALPTIGSVDQLSHVVDFLENSELRIRAQHLYPPPKESYSKKCSPERRRRPLPE